MTITRCTGAVLLALAAVSATAAPIGGPSFNLPYPVWVGGAVLASSYSTPYQNPQSHVYTSTLGYADCMNKVISQSAATAAAQNLVVVSTQPCVWSGYYGAAIIRHGDAGDADAVLSELTQALEQLDQRYRVDAYFAERQQILDRYQQGE